MSVKLKVCTFNLRVISSGDGINIFENRKGRVLETVREYAPDLIGFQEASDSMHAFLRDSLREYTLIGCGREADLRGEHVPLAFRTEAFEMIRSECFWLSPTPSVAGSRYEDQSSCPRITTAVLLKHHSSDRYFWFINTHLDHKSSSARQLGAQHLVNYIGAHSESFVMTGDFNATPDSPEILIFTENERIKNATDNIGGTFHAFGKIPSGEMKQIDYIFTDLKADASESFSVKDEPKNGIYISDHRPVFAFVEI